jgi:hypothetical protein
MLTAHPVQQRSGKTATGCQNEPAPGCHLQPRHLLYPCGASARLAVLKAIAATAQRDTCR